MEKIADISELCRVCLDSARELIPFNKKLYYTHYAIVDIIHFCTGVIYNDTEEENILPKHLCKSCLQKFQTAYELKTKCIESDKYLSSILSSTVPDISQQELPGIEIDETPFMPSSHTMSYYGESNDDNGDNDSPDDHSSEKFMEEIIQQQILKYNGGSYKSKKRKGARNMKNGGTSTCNICQKVFTYIKSYNRHMEKHEEASQPEETYNVLISDQSNDVSCDDSAKVSYQARSRSPSIEIVPEFDAIAEVYKITPDSDDNHDVASTPRQFAAKSVGKHRCKICGQSFALKVYLSKHKRREHPRFTMIQD